MFDPSFMAPVAILSLIFVAVSFLLSHYMDDHDGYTGRLSKLQYYYMIYKTNDEPCNYMNSIVANKTKYLFSWNSVPGDDDEKFKEFLRDYFDIEWAENAEILKSDDGKTISIIKDENLAKIELDKKKKKATLVSDGKTLDLKVKKENGKLNIYKTKIDKEIIDECNWFRIALIHFGPISLTLMACFLVAIFIATYLMIKLIQYCEPSLRNTNLLIVLIILMVNLILLSQLWFYSKQGNLNARWIKELQRIEFDKCCQKYLEKIIIPSSRTGEGITKMRLWLARVDYEDYPNLYTNILFLILVIILVLCIYFFCFCG